MKSKLEHRTLGEHGVAGLGPPPQLAGYTYGAREAHEARDQDRLLAVRLETNRSCNLNCRYCYAESGIGLDEEADPETLKEVIRQAKDLGAESIVVIGGGEPTLYRGFAALLGYINSLGLIPVVFTNMVKVTPDLAKLLYENNASVMGKLDSLRRELQDYLSGRRGAWDRMQAGFNNLVQAGFTQPEDGRRLRLGLSFVSNRFNLAEIERFWHLCRQHSIFPNIEVLTPTGRARNFLHNQFLTTREIQDYKERLLEIDRLDYGFTWLPHTPLPGSGCLQYLYSLYITIQGSVRPCAPTKLDQNPDLFENGVYPYSIPRMSLREVFDSDLFRYVRTIDERLEGKCASCLHAYECIGCRGYAYSVGVLNGLDPYQAMRGECLQCSR